MNKNFAGKQMVSTKIVVKPLFFIHYMNKYDNLECKGPWCFMFANNYKPDWRKKGCSF